MSRVVIELKAGGITNDDVANVTFNGAPAKTLTPGTTYTLNKKLKFTVSSAFSGKYVGVIFIGYEV